MKTLDRELTISLLFMSKEFRFVAAYIYPERKNVLKIVVGSTHRNLINCAMKKIIMHMWCNMVSS